MKQKILSEITASAKNNIWKEKAKKNLADEKNTQKVNRKNIRTPKYIEMKTKKYFAKQKYGIRMQLSVFQ